MGDVIALSDITPSGVADRSQEPSPVGSRHGRVTPNLSRASSDADHGVSKWMLTGRYGKVGNGGGSVDSQWRAGDWQKDEMGGERKIDNVNRGKQQSMGKGRRPKGSEMDGQTDRDQWAAKH